MTMGDNLAEARRFSNLCQETMGSLMKGVHPLPKDAILMLETLQSQARHMKARAISRTAALVIHDLSAAKADTRSLGSLLALNKLVCQYTEGLDEIAPENVLVATNSGEFDEKMQALLVMQEAEMRAAQDLTQSLLFLARPGRQRENLRALAGMSHLGSSGSDGRPADTFDVIMPAVTNEALRRARLEKKSVSVSYAADDFRIDPPLTRVLQSAVITICEGLVERCIEAPLRRQNLGLSGAAHIAITAKQRESVFDILVTCEGPAPSDGFLSDKSVTDLLAYDAIIDINQSKGLTRIEMKSLPIADQATSPVRTPLPARAEMRA